MNESIKRRIIGAIELLPYGQDLYLKLRKNSLGISYRGVFPSHEKARANIPNSQNKYYDIINKDKADNLERELKLLDNKDLSDDYPLMFWLSRILDKKMNILELGGNIGHAFYSFQQYMPYPESIQWTIAELEEAVTLGRKIAQDRNEKRLSFIESQNIAEAASADLFSTSGTLQYMEQSLTEIIKSLKASPEHILIHNLPTHRQRSYWTLQRLEYGNSHNLRCELPYKIYSSSDLTTSLNQLGYTLVDKWNKKRQIKIPFHLDVKIEGYSGFYFKKRR